MKSVSFEQIPSPYDYYYSYYIYLSLRGAHEI